MTFLAWLSLNEIQSTIIVEYTIPFNHKCTSVSEELSRPWKRPGGPSIPYMYSWINCKRWSITCRVWNAKRKKTLETNILNGHLPRPALVLIMPFSWPSLNEIHTRPKAVYSIALIHKCMDASEEFSTPSKSPGGPSMPNSKRCMYCNIWSISCRVWYASRKMTLYVITLIILNFFVLVIAKVVVVIGQHPLFAYLAA